MTADVAYVLSSALWSLGGLVVGYILGKAAGRRQALVIVERSGKDPAAVAVHTPSRLDIAIGLVVVVMAVVSVATAAVSVSRQQAQVTCQTRYNEAFTAALTERSDAATAERSAQRALLTATLGGNPVESRAAINAYLDTLARADEKRGANPLPAHPDR